MTSLYLDRLPEQDRDFKKLAAFASRLSEQAENWPQELTSELFKQLPFLSDYDVNVNLDRVEPQRGFAFGYADVASKTERPEVEHAETGIPHIRIPLVIIERAVKPFSIFLDGELVLPLTEHRVREILFNPATFDLSTSQPRDPSLVEAMMPPQRTGMGGGETKTASDDRKERAKRGVRAGAVAGAAGGALGSHLSPLERMHVVDHAKNQTHLNVQNHPDKMVRDWAKERLHHANVGKTLRGGAKGALIGGVTLGTVGYLTGKRSKGKAKESSILLDIAATISERDAEALGGGETKTAAAEKPSKLRRAVIGAAVTGAGLYGAHKLHVRGKKTKSIGEVAKDIAAKADRDVAGWQANVDKHFGPGKEKKGSLLLAIASTIGERDADAFVEKVANDATLRAGFRRSGITNTLVEAFDLTKRASAGERLEALADRIEPTCITFQKLPGGDFLVKSANKNAFQQGPDAKGQVVPQEEVAEAMGPENAQAMKPGQTATAVTDPAQGAAPPAENKSKIIDEFCQCKVQDMMGNSLIGNCFPQSLAWDGAFTPSPIAIFTNGSVYAMQDTVAGELLGKATNLPSDAPRGDGVFYSTEGGEAICTAPVTIGSSAAGPDGLPVLMGTDSFGTQLQISMAEGLKSPQRISDVEYALPASWKFMRLNNQTQLVPDPSQMNKQASARAEGGSVTLFYNGGYHLSGGCGLEKLSADYRHDLDPVSAEFMLGVLGVDGVTAKQKVAEARKRGSVKLAGLHTITTLAERYAGATKTASALMSKIPNLRRDLTKEAASIEDQGTVDSILSLNFINPENLATFVSYVPQLEMCGEKLAEMLLSSYLGMQELPEGAIDRAMKNLEEVIQGLKNIEHSMGGEDQPQ